jgi:hypothetical protein
VVIVAVPSKNLIKAAPVTNFHFEYLITGSPPRCIAARERAPKPQSANRRIG